MSVTRDPNYPVEAAQLMQAFNMAADGFNAGTVLNASMQMVAAGVGYICKNKGASLEQALGYADHIAATIKAEVEDNWSRKPAATDVQVKPS